MVLQNAKFEFKSASVMLSIRCLPGTMVNNFSYFLPTGSRTPHYGSQTPSHDPSRTPSHVGIGGAWDPTQPNTPARPSDDFDYTFDAAGPSPVSFTLDTIIVTSLVSCIVFGISV